MVQVAYKHNSIGADFIPGGAAWQDYTLRQEIYLRNAFYAKAELQYENISRYPALFRGPQTNLTAIVEVGFYPRKNVRADGNTP
jgi:hypothetical protein